MPKEVTVPTHPVRVQLQLVVEAQMVKLRLG